MGNAGAYGAVAGERPMEQMVYTSRFLYLQFLHQGAGKDDDMGTIFT